MENKKLTISVIVPVLNEEKNIPVLYRRLTTSLDTFNYEILFVNDGSTDKSEDEIQKLRVKDKNVKLINLSRNFGHQMAITCGIDHVMGDAAIIIDSDLQDPPEIIPKMIIKWQEGFDVVYGVRKERKGESPLKLITANFFYALIRLLSGTKIPQNVGDFRLISRNIIEVLKTSREYQRFLRGIISWAGFKQTGINFTRDRRYAGNSKYTTFAMIKLAIDALLSFSFLPLRIASILGLLTTTVSVGLLVYSLYVTAEGRTVRGWSSLIVTMLFLGSVQLISLGIIGEYLGRIYEEVKSRPLYVVSKSFGLNARSPKNKRKNQI